jgi:flavin reductase (DIM6/NTAB) family NADH-FMN oxidoreductase RutF
MTLTGPLTEPDRTEAGYPEAGPMDPARFRHVFGHYPTGVVAITSRDETGAPVGMAVGTFGSASLNPPLVTFLVDHASSTWPHIRQAGVFCANVLSSTQHVVSHALARRGGEKFADLAWTESPVTSSPLLEGVAAWFDCRIVAVHEVGDHDLVVGEVLALDLASAADGTEPLIFLRGGYVQVAGSEPPPAR